MMPISRVRSRIVMIMVFAIPTAATSSAMRVRAAEVVAGEAQDVEDTH